MGNRPQYQPSEPLLFLLLSCDGRMVATVSGGRETLFLGEGLVRLLRIAPKTERQRTVQSMGCHICWWVMVKCLIGFSLDQLYFTMVEC